MFIQWQYREAHLLFKIEDFLKEPVTNFIIQVPKTSIGMVFYRITFGKVVTIDGEFATPSCKVVITVGKVVFDTVIVVTQLDNVATNAE